jgi:phosphoribosylamine--glycine ligase
MKLLLIGGGGREHALAWKLAASSRVTQLFCAPGNPGIAQVADLVPLKATDLTGIEKFVKANKIDLVVIGPEDPLALGMADRLTAAGAKVFGPSKAAAQLEADKWFAKEIMRHQAIPKPDHFPIQWRPKNTSSPATSRL